MHCTSGLKDGKASPMGAFPAEAVEVRGRVARAAEKAATMTVFMVVPSRDPLWLPVTGVSRQLDQLRRHSCAGPLGQSQPGGEEWVLQTIVNRSDRFLLAYDATRIQGFERLMHRRRGKSVA